MYFAQFQEQEKKRKEDATARRVAKKLLKQSSNQATETPAQKPKPKPKEKTGPNYIDGIYIPLNLRTSDAPQETEQANIQAYLETFLGRDEDGELMGTRRQYIRPGFRGAADRRTTTYCSWIDKDNNKDIGFRNM